MYRPHKHQKHPCFIRPRHLPSLTWLIRSLKQDNSRILLPIAFYLTLLANNWQALLARSNLCAQQVHSHDAGVENKWKTLSVAFLPNSIFSAHVQDQVAHVRKMFISVYEMSVKPALCFQSALSFLNWLFLQLKVNESWNMFFSRSFITVDGHKCLCSSASLSVRRGYLTAGS